MSTVDIKHLSLCCSGQIESQIGSSSTQENAVTLYFELCGVCLRLEKSLCLNLKHFAFSLRNHWSCQLREKLSRYRDAYILYYIMICTQHKFHLETVGVGYIVS